MKWVFFLFSFATGKGLRALTIGIFNWPGSKVLFRAPGLALDMKCLLPLVLQLKPIRLRDYV